MVDFSIRGDAGVMAEIRNVVPKKTEVEVLPVVDICPENRLFIFFFVSDATQVAPPAGGADPNTAPWPHPSSGYNMPSFKGVKVFLCSSDLFFSRARRLMADAAKPFLGFRRKTVPNVKRFSRFHHTTL